MVSTPVQPNQRIHYLDVVRGFAITGVLFAYVAWNLGNAPADTYSAFDIVLDKTTSFIIDSKCYTLLANLFAIGFVLHMSKTGNPARSLYIYRKRLVGLLIIGLLHAILLRNGDILAPYALLMLVVSFLYTSSNRTIIIVMVITFFLSILIPETGRMLQLSFPQRPAAGDANYWVDNFEWVKYWYTTAIFYWESTLFFLLSGLLLGRVFIQNKKQLTNTQLKTVAVLGLIAGAASYCVLKFYNDELSRLPDLGNTRIIRGTLNSMLWLIHKVGLASAYASVLFLLCQRFRFTIWANLGRMSLTNYILQAIIVVPVCLFFNLFERITPSIALIMAASIWIIQVWFSQWWLRRHRFGPLEWALRRFTYGKTIDRKKVREEAEIVASGSAVL